MHQLGTRKGAIVVGFWGNKFKFTKLFKEKRKILLRIINE
jgi:hypothetical protein